MFIDTHCHISKEEEKDLSFFMQENKKNKVDKIIASFCEKESMKDAFLLSSQEDIYLSFGYHPSEAGEIQEEDLKLLEKNLTLNKVVALGEIGLDYHYGKENKLDQQDLFEKQLQIAEKMHLPVIIHSRDATYDTINLLKKYKVRGVIHCFSGSVETALEYIRMGYFLGIGGVITFKNSNLPRVIEQIPLSAIVLETDSPYLSPEPYRGRTNSSKNIPIIAQKIAEIKNVSLEEVENQTTQNAFQIFDF